MVADTGVPVPPTIRYVPAATWVSGQFGFASPIGPVSHLSWLQSSSWVYE